jgi:pre-mRNA-splicing factor ATP-dependent RNA helicase DHX16
VKKQSTYKLLADEEDDDIDNHTSSTAGAASKSRKHFRRKAEDQDDGKDDDVRDGVVAASLVVLLSYAVTQLDTVVLQETVTHNSERSVRRRTEEVDDEDGNDTLDVCSSSRNLTILYIKNAYLWMIS